MGNCHADRRSRRARPDGKEIAFHRTDLKGPSVERHLGSEAFRCLIAALKKEPDIALGNIVGSNIFNILGILGTAALTQPMVGTGIKMTDIYVALGFAALLLPILRSGFTLHRWEGALLVAGYIGYVAWLWPK